MWDVGGQKSLRSYWRNYFECTDGLIWVVDSADKRRLNDCKEELHQLLKEEVRIDYIGTTHFSQREKKIFPLIHITNFKTILTCHYYAIFMTFSYHYNQQKIFIKHILESVNLKMQLSFEFWRQKENYQQCFSLSYI